MLWNFRRSIPGTREARYDTLHQAASDVLSDYLKRMRFNPEQPVPPVVVPGVALPPAASVGATVGGNVVKQTPPLLPNAAGTVGGGEVPPKFQFNPSNLAHHLVFRPSFLLVRTLASQA